MQRYINILILSKNTVLHFVLHTPFLPPTDSLYNAYGAIPPSCPPAFAYDNALYDHISNFISNLLSSVPLYHLECLPDRDAALLACSTVF